MYDTNARYRCWFSSRWRYFLVTRCPCHLAARRGNRGPASSGWNCRRNGAHSILCHWQPPPTFFCPPSSTVRQLHTEMLPEETFKHISHKSSGPPFRDAQSLWRFGQEVGSGSWQGESPITDAESCPCVDQSRGELHLWPGFQSTIWYNLYECKHLKWCSMLGSTPISCIRYHQFLKGSGADRVGTFCTVSSETVLWSFLAVFLYVFKGFLGAKWFHRHSSMLSRDLGGQMVSSSFEMNRLQQCCFALQSLWMEGVCPWYFACYLSS